MRKLALIFALGALTAFPQYASAQANSGIDQYEENVPGAGGDRPSDGGGGDGGGRDGGGTAPSGGGGGSSSGSIDTGAVNPGSSPAPTDAGAAGGAGAQGSAADSAERTGGSGSRDAQDGDVGSVAAEEGSGVANPADAVEDTSGGGGMGIALPIILGASLLAALLVLVARRRRASGQAPSA